MRRRVQVSDRSYFDLAVVLPLARKIGVLVHICKGGFVDDLSDVVDHILLLDADLGAGVERVLLC